MQSSSQNHTAASASEERMDSGPIHGELGSDKETPQADAPADAGNQDTGSWNVEKPANVEAPATQETSKTGAGLEKSTEVKERKSSVMESAVTISTKKGQSQVKRALEGKKYVPSKKAMIDPLKMDMTKPVVMPLTASQISLHCIECHIIFSDQKTKERHVKLKHPAEYERNSLQNALFACYVCDRHFTNSVDLMVHQKAHTERTPFKCPLCEQAFKKSSELTAHKKIHGEGSYACSECGKMCKSLTLLKYHQRSHTGEMPYVCKECGKRFPMSKALLKHMDTHLPEGAEVPDRVKKPKIKKKDSLSQVRYPCYMCKATFKGSKTRMRHMKTKHNVTAFNDQSKQSSPVITPLSISETGFLQVEPNGPLQKVDADCVATEQIRKLIESLGNVQKVNQVVILGQVPPHAPPLELKAVPEPPQTLNIQPPQINLEGLNFTQSTELGSSSSLCNFMEQTIILEPITPDGPLENPSFSELGACMASGEAEQPVQTMDVVIQPPGADGFDSAPMICQDNDLEQTIILELMPTSELEQFQSESQDANQEPADQTTDKTLVDNPETVVSEEISAHTSQVPLILELEHQEVSSCPLAPPEKLTVAPNESNTDTKLDEDSHGDAERMNPLEKVKESTPNQTDDVSETKPKEGTSDVADAEELSAKKDGDSQEKQEPQISEPPINVMSAQELVKVRKRKPARMFFYPGYIQDLAGSIYKDSFPTDAKPTKRQKQKKEHLVVKFGPQSKESKSRKQSQKPQLQQMPTGALAKNKVSPKKSPEKKASPSAKKGGKGKKDSTVGAVASGAVTKSPPTTQSPQGKLDKDSARKNKVKKQKGTNQGKARINDHKPMFKKKQAKLRQKDQATPRKDGKLKKKQTSEEKVTKTDNPDPNAVQDSLSLLKGHKQPQLKVYKLDPIKASTQSPEALISQTSINLPPETKTKGQRVKRNQKALSLLSSLKGSRPVPDASPVKPKVARKRKASSKVEAEGVITSKRVLECKDCGETFSDVSSLQKHKTDAHAVESPSLTYTNGNIFEGVSRTDFYQLPKAYGGARATVKNAASGWDTEPETTETAPGDKEPDVSFPALVPSPSLPVSPQTADPIALQSSNRAEGKVSSDVGVSTDEVRNCETQSDLNHSSLTKTCEGLLSLGRLEETAIMDPGSKSRVQGKTVEGVKEDPLLEIDLVDQGNRDTSPLDPDGLPQEDLNGPESEVIGKCTEEGHGDPTKDKVTLQTISCSTDLVEIKEEEEEVPVQRRREERRVVAGFRKRRGARFQKGGETRTTSSIGDSLGSPDVRDESDSCQIVYEIHRLSPDCEAGSRPRSKKAVTNAASTLAVPSTLDKPATGLAPFDPEPTTTTHCAPVEDEHVARVAEQMERESDPSPGIVLERVLTPRDRVDRDRGKDKCSGTQKEDFNRAAKKSGRALWSQEVKVEENPPDPSLSADACDDRQVTSVQPPDHRDIRTVLVKEECGPMPSEAQDTQIGRHMPWLPENDERTPDSVTENGETAEETPSAPEFNSSQCIFYPVKEEEREVLLGGSSSPLEPGEANPTLNPGAEGNQYEGRLSAPGYDTTGVGESGVGDFGNGQVVSEWDPSELREFLLRSSDEGVTSDLEASDPQLDLEAEVMAYFNRKRSSSSRYANRTAKRFPAASSRSEAHIDQTRPKEPIDYFSMYFGQNTWAGIASCTNQMSKTSRFVTAKDVARFVGIHIAMGTLKFPSPRLYWEDLTKVPLIAEAMPLARFLELSRSLTLSSPPGDHTCDNVDEQRWDRVTSAYPGVESEPGERFRNDGTNDPSCLLAEPDPLWKVQPLLCRFNSVCQSLRQQEHYAIDQYTLPLTRSVSDNRPSLLCTALIGYGGLLLGVDLGVDPSLKEVAVEKMAPKQSMVFLCKQDLSTPAMMERLLDAGVHAAGRVGGARGQIGDEFVSSDGKLMLRRSHGGFILSTAGSGQRSMASLTSSFESAWMSARLSRDLQRLYPTPLTASPSTCWPQAVMWYLTDLALVNSWLQHQEDQTADTATLTFMAFRLEISKSLILSSNSETQDSIPPPPRSEENCAASEGSSPMLVEESPLPDTATRYDGMGHWPEQLGEGEGGRCRFGDCQRTSRVLCLKCCVFLCISRHHNCFLNFHSQESLGRR